MPVRADTAPVALVIAVQRSQPVQVHTNAPEPTPAPLGPTMQVVIVVVLAPQMPIRTNVVPAMTVPPAEDAQAIQVTSNTAVPAPEPSVRLVIMVPAPQVPVGSHTTPVTLVIPVKCSQTVEMDTNAPESAPGPPVATVQMVIVIIATPQVPVTTHVVPA